LRPRTLPLAFLRAARLDETAHAYSSSTSGERGTLRENRVVGNLLAFLSYARRHKSPRLAEIFPAEEKNLTFTFHLRVVGGITPSTEGAENGSRQRLRLVARFLWHVGHV
jgi:hypothetical protein